jgi:hypothetical protein
MGGWLSLWAHWGILRRSDATEEIKRTPKGRLVTVLLLSALAAAGGIAMGVTNSFPLVMGIAGAFFAVFLLGFVPVYAWHFSKEGDAKTHKSMSLGARSGPG